MVDNKYYGDLEWLQEQREKAKENNKLESVDKKIDDIVTQSNVLKTAHLWTGEIIDRLDLCSHKMYQFISRTMFLCASRVISEGLHFEEIFKQSVEDAQSVLYKFDSPLQIFVEAGLAGGGGTVKDNFLSDPVIIDRQRVMQESNEDDAGASQNSQ